MRFILQSYKTSTSVLENDEGEFVEFGFDAEELYSQVIQSQEGGKYSLYRHFKMMLHKTGVSMTLLAYRRKPLIMA